MIAILYKLYTLYFYLIVIAPVICTVAEDSIKISYEPVSSIVKV